MPKQGCPFVDAAPLQLKVRVGWRELGRGMCAERYSQEIFGECGVGLPLCDAGPGQAVPAGRAPRSREVWGPRELRFGAGQAERMRPCPPARATARKKCASLSKRAAADLRGCRTRVVAVTASTGVPRASDRSGSGTSWVEQSGRSTRSNRAVFEERALPARHCGCARDAAFRELPGPVGDQQGKGMSTHEPAGTGRRRATCKGVRGLVEEQSLSGILQGD